MGLPLSAAVWSVLGGFAAYRALVRPTRAVFDQGEVTACPGGAGCARGLAIRSSRGIAAVYALVSGTVTRVAGDRIELASSVEPVLVSYQGISTASVAVGQAVKAGQPIGQAAELTLSVAQIQRYADGRLGTVGIEPASWLASRGLRPAARTTPGALWCQAGRSLVVPQDVARCGLRLPDPPGFSLLPVTVRLT